MRVPFEMRIMSSAWICQSWSDEKVGSTHPMANDSALAALNDTWQHADTRRKTTVRTIDEYIDIRTLIPFLNRSIDCLLNIASVEVDRSSFWQVIEGSWETKHIPKLRTSCCNLIDVKAGIDVEDFVVDAVPESAVVECISVLVCAWKLSREWPWRWEGQIFADVVVVAACF